MIYLDNAATTKTAPEVVEAMLPYFVEYYGNPSAMYSMGSAAKRAIQESRRLISEVISAKPEEIYFTAGGSESDNWALKAIAEGYADKGRHIITTKIEHHAILHTCQYLEKQGFSVTYLDVDELGKVKIEELKASIRPETILISVMFANNEIGTIQPIKEIGKIAHEKGILFHTDAVQAFGHLAINVEEMNIDLLSASAHKLNGPKGVGMLYVNKKVKIPSLIHGGMQEKGRRAGTENVPGIVGFGAAASRAKRLLEERTRKEKELQEYLINCIESQIPDSVLNGDRQMRIPGNVNFSFRSVEGESLLIMLDMEGICASSGSACTTGAIDPSHVLLAIGRSPEEARGSIRLSLSMETTMEELDFVVATLKRCVKRLRELRI